MGDTDDWEHAEIDLNSLRIKAEEVSNEVSAPKVEDNNDFDAPSKSKAGSVTIPPHLAARTDLDFNFTSGGYGLETLDEPIDTSLVEAKDNPRERMNILSIESNIIKFLKSTSTSLELPAQSNGYRRSLLYKILARFRLVYELSQTMNEYGERGFIVYKTEETCFQSQLLIDTIDDEEQNKSGDSAASNAPKKVPMLMKRVPSKENSKKETNNKSAQSDVDKEAAYNAARARIFGENNTPPLSRGASGDNIAAIDSNSNNNSSSGGNIPRKNSRNNMNEEVSKGKNKSLERNVHDPDFNRRNAHSMGVTPGFMPYEQNFNDHSNMYPAYAPGQAYYVPAYAAYPQVPPHVFQDPQAFQGNAYNPQYAQYQQAFPVYMNNSNNKSDTAKKREP